MIKNVAIYCRVSTEEQKKYGISIEDQKDSLTRYCKENKYKIYDYYMDEGVSAGTISKRKEFLRMINDLDNIDLILFTRLDRFSRNVRDANNMLITLDEHNTAFRAIDDDDIDVSTADGRFIFNLKVNLAERERNIDSERIKRTFKYRYNVVKKVCTGKAPFGYKINENKQLVIDEENSKKVRELFDYFIKTHCLLKTVEWFSKTYEYRSDVAIKKYLKNPTYIGKYRTWKGEIIEDFCPAIINEETFKKAQSIFKKNIKVYTSVRHNNFIFIGLIKCAECGRRMSGRGNGKYSNYYVCRWHDKKKCNNNKYTREDYIEKYLIENIKKTLNNKLIEVNKISNQINNNKNNIKTIKSKLNKLSELYINDMIDYDYYKEEYNKLKKILEQEKEKIPKKVNKQTIEKINTFLKQDIEAIYNNLTNDEKRQLWSSIIDYIEIKDKKIINIIVY